MNQKRLFKRTFKLFRRWRRDRDGCGDPDHMPTDARIFRNAAERNGMDARVAAMLADRCFANRPTMDDRLFELHDYLSARMDAPLLTLT